MNKNRFPIFYISLFIIVTFYYNLCKAQQEYLPLHVQNISKGIQRDSGVFNKQFFSKKLFILTEIHGAQKPQKVDFNMIKFLNHEIGVTKYLGEFDFSKAYFLNKYLKTGKEILLKKVFEDWNKENAQWGNLDFYNKIKKIRSLNQTLSPKNKITFIGLDIIQNKILAGEYFKHLGKKYPTIEKEISSLYSELLNNSSDSILSPLALKIKNQLRYIIKSKGYSKEVYNEIIYPLDNVILLGNTPREQALYINFKNLYFHNNWQKEKLYGFWGFYHGLQAKVNNGQASPFATLLINDSSLHLKNKMLSMACIYVDSYSMLPSAALPETIRNKNSRYTNTNIFNDDGQMVHFLDIDSLKKATQPNTVSAINLIGKNSPYKHQLAQLKYSENMPVSQRLYLNEKNKKIADYFQYIFLIRNSPATRPLPDDF